jgi:DNA (cytosine-5)-methyltransferase 1
VRYLSVCSGIESATVAWHPLGWTPVAFAEIERFPCAVLAHHYPRVPNWGDLTRFKDWPDAAVDVLVGGTPCQSFSVAGLRQGLADPRGNLALTYLALIDRYRPRWVVWENVPGVLSATSHDAPDPCPPVDDVDEGTERVVEDEYDADEVHAFGCFLAGLSELGYGFAYGSLDAQYAGLAQRRERVFVVGHLGSWTRPAAVLFEPTCLSGDPAPRREARESVTATTRAGTDDGREHNALSPDVAGSLGAGDGPRGWRNDLDQGAFIPEIVHQAMSSKWAKGSSGPAGDEVCNLVAPTVPSRRTAGGGLGTDFDCDGGLIAHPLRGDGFDASEDGTGRGTPLVPIAFSAKDHGADAGDLAPTLRAGSFTTSHANGGVMPAVAYGLRSDASRDGDAKTPSADAEGRVRLRDPGFNVYEELAPTVDAGQPHTVAFDMRGRDGGNMPEGPHDTANIRAASGGSSRSLVVPFADVADPVAANQANTYTREGSNNFRLSNVAHTAMQVRRLTPLECERLQGFPDHYTLIPYRGKFAADAPRYKALGNAMAVPCMTWIGEQIAFVDTIPHEEE